MTETPATTMVQPVATCQGSTAILARGHRPARAVVGDRQADRVDPQLAGVDVAEDELHIRRPAFASELRAQSPDAFTNGTSGQSVNRQSRPGLYGSRSRRPRHGGTGTDRIGLFDRKGNRIGRASIGYQNHFDLIATGQFARQGSQDDLIDTG